MNLSSDEDEGGKRDPVKIVAGHIGKFKDLLMTPKGARSHVENQIAEGNRIGAAIDVIGLTMAAKVYPEYQTGLREENAADFGGVFTEGRLSGPGRPREGLAMLAEWGIYAGRPGPLRSYVARDKPVHAGEACPAHSRSRCCFRRMKGSRPGHQA